jgi:hypothetical protein
MNYPTYGQEPPQHGGAQYYPQYQQPGYPPQYPPQQFGGPPPPYQPQQAQAQPQKYEGDLADAFGVESRKAISWESAPNVSVPHGTRRMLLVESGPAVLHGRDFTTKQLQYWPDGNPKWKIAVQVVDENGEDRGLWMGKPSAMGAAIASAEGNAGFKIIDTPWCLLDITYTHDKQGSDPRTDPAKQFRVMLIPPAAALHVMTPGQRQAMEHKVAQTDAPTQDAPQYAPPVQQPVAPQQYQQPMPPSTVPPGTGQVPYVPPAQPQQYVAPQQYQQPMPPSTVPPGTGQVPYVPPVQQAVAPQRMYGPAGDLTVEILTMFRAMEDAQIMALGRNPIEIRQAIEAAQRDSVLPPF